MRYFWLLAIGCLLIFLYSGCSLLGLQGEKKSIQMDHLLLLVFDGMRPDYIDRFELKNFKRLQALSQNYTEATVGYLGSETVVSHLVLSSGLKPKDLPWGDDVFYDLGGILGVKKKFYVTGELSFDQMSTLMQTLPASSYLASELKKQFQASVVAIGQKNYATLAMGSPEADSIITLKKRNGLCSVDGIRVPEYILKNDRFNLDCNEKYGTEKSFYPYDGNRFVPGTDSKHVGGDAWVTDAAFEVMDHQKWSGLFLTFGAIDKVAHLLGEQDAPPRPSLTKSINTPYDLKFILANADAQLGRILDQLEKKGLMNRTLVVVTADHGGQSDYHYLGKGHSKYPSKWVRSFTHLKGVRESFQDSAIRTWTDESVDPKSLVAVLKKVPGVIEIDQLKKVDGIWSYARIYTDYKKQTPHARDWSRTHHEEIIAAIPNERAPNFITLLDDGYGFDLVGDHGGAQENVQRIPLMMMVPGVAPKNRNEAIHLDELKALIHKRMLTPVPFTP